MKFLKVIICLLISTNVLATIECEKRMLESFKTTSDVDVNKVLETMDNRHPTQDKLSKCMYDKSASMSQFDSIMAIGGRFKVSDTRKNQIIRVCTAISAFISLGMDQEKVERAIIGFDDGWSRSMTGPLSQIISDELKAKQDAEAPCDKFIEVNNQPREIQSEKSQKNEKRAVKAKKEANKQ